MADWSDLPHELLGLILRRLNRLDVIRCGSVSKSWFSAQQEHARPLKLPWLLYGDDDHDTKSRGIFSLNEQKIDHLVLPNLLGRWCCGSSHGWIFTVDAKLRLHLLHPFTGSQITLPRLPPYDKDYSISPDDYQEFQPVYVLKGILSCDPIKSREECVVMIIFGCQRKLAFCKIGAKKWKVLPRLFAIYTDVIFYKGKFHAVDARGYFSVCDIVGPVRRVKQCAPHCDEKLTNHHYLVDFMGDLLHVESHLSYYEYVWYMGYDNEVMYKRCSFFKDRDLEDRPLNPPSHDDVADYRCFTYYFDVFKFDPVNYKWEKVESLGDHAIFLGSNYSKCVLASSYPGCKANCIYFTDFCFDKPVDHGYEDNGVFDLESETIEPIFSTELFHPTSSPPMWYFPP